NAEASAGKPVTEKKGVVTVQVEKGSYMRVRFTGSAALEICRFLGEDLAKRDPGFMAHLGKKKTEKGEETMSCFTAGTKKKMTYGFGFILDKEKSFGHLESLGYD